MHEYTSVCMYWWTYFYISNDRPKLKLFESWKYMELFTITIDSGSSHRVRTHRVNFTPSFLQQSQFPSEGKWAGANEALLTQGNEGTKTPMWLQDPAKIGYLTPLDFFENLSQTRILSHRAGKKQGQYVYFMCFVVMISNLFEKQVPIIDKDDHRIIKSVSKVINLLVFFLIKSQSLKSTRIGLVT